MLPRPFVSLLSVVTLALLITSPLRADDESEIRATFDAFKANAMAGDTTKAAESLAPSVFAYYDKLKVLALKKNTTSSGLPVVDHLGIEILRKRVPGNLAGKTLPQVATDGITAGWIQVEGLKDIGMGLITVTGDTATGTLISKNETTSWSIPFLKTPAGWKIDPLAFYKVGDLLLKAEIMRNGFNESKTINSIVASMTPKKKN